MRERERERESVLTFVVWGINALDVGIEPATTLLSEKPSIDQTPKRLSRQHQKLSEVTENDLLKTQSTIVVFFCKTPCL
jgi:hypothetical protein